MKTITKPVILVALAACVSLTLAQGDKDPDLSTVLPVCYRDDPKIDDCILRAAEQLKPTLKTGISELEVPAIDPLYVDEVVINPNGGAFRGLATGITVKGISNFNIFRFKSDLERNTFYIGVEFPFMEFHGNYEMNVPTPFMKIKGAGPVQGNTTMVRVNAVLEGKVVKRENQSFYQFKTLDVDIKIKDFKINFKGLFPDKFLDEMVMNMINERSSDFAWAAEPIAERAVSPVILGFIDRITRHLPIEKLFPERLE